MITREVKQEYQPTEMTNGWLEALRLDPWYYTDVHDHAVIYAPNGSTSLHREFWKSYKTVDRAQDALVDLQLNTFYQKLGYKFYLADLHLDSVYPRRVWGKWSLTDTVRYVKDGSKVFYNNVEYELVSSLTTPTIRRLQLYNTTSGETLSNIDSRNCISEKCYWVGNALSASGIQY